jgi:hypothetical protein
MTQGDMMNTFEGTYLEITERIGEQLATREAELAICEENLKQALFYDNMDVANLEVTCRGTLQALVNAHREKLEAVRTRYEKDKPCVEEWRSAIQQAKATIAELERLLLPGRGSYDVTLSDYEARRVELDKKSWLPPKEREELASIVTILKRLPKERAADEEKLARARMSIERHEANIERQTELLEPLIGGLEEERRQRWAAKDQKSREDMRREFSQQARDVRSVSASTANADGVAV